MPQKSRDGLQYQRAVIVPCAIAMEIIEEVILTRSSFGTARDRPALAARHARDSTRALELDSAVTLLITVSRIGPPGALSSSWHGFERPFESTVFELGGVGLPRWVTPSARCDTR